MKNKQNNPAYILDEMMKRKIENKRDWKMPVRVGNNFFCPHCENELVEMQGKFGSFLACIDYDFCGYTSPLTLEEQVEKRDMILGSFAFGLTHEGAGDRD